MGELCIHSKSVATLGMVRDSYGTPMGLLGTLWDSKLSCWPGPFARHRRGVGRLCRSRPRKGMVREVIDSKEVTHRTVNVSSHMETI